MIGISNLPQEPAIGRKVRVDNIEIDFVQKWLIFICKVLHFNQQGEAIPNVITPKEARLIASNDLFVDVQGDYLLDAQGQPITVATEGAVGEFDFWVAYLQNRTFDFDALKAQLVQRADTAFNRFDKLY